MHCTKISHEFECQGQSSKVKVTKDKNMLSAADSPGCVRMVCARCKQCAAVADGPMSWLPRGVLGACVQCTFGESPFALVSKSVNN